MTVAALVDYGVGNMHSITKALEQAGFTVVPVEDEGDLAVADAIVLPGVGAFEPAADALEPIGETIHDAVDDGAALLGVCLGMQLMYEGSEEGAGDGLGFFAGNIRRIEAPRVPHIGWTELDTRPNGFVNGLDGEHVYYVHSYAAPPDGPEVVATSRHGETFAAISRDDRVVGTQFHPEKSSSVGLRILSRFRALVEDEL